MSEDPDIQASFDDILHRIIDEWYENVSNYYVTQEQLDAEGDKDGKVELKRFHDGKGHRIKFDKDDLDFTYGLRFHQEEVEGPEDDQEEDGEGPEYIIEVSVNNKVPNFDYDDFQTRLTQHYRRYGSRDVPTPYELTRYRFDQVFEFRPSLREAFEVERPKGKADIMRLKFVVADRYMQKLAIHPVAGKELVEQYCVSPFRSVYAAVYRNN
ncbi:MAG TPA: hypothetical protein VLU25_13195 [Acidobacteriota bacterium]|nr:hypothetical protein [Acidobacteriota bacterium]